MILQSKFKRIALGTLATIGLLLISLWLALPHLIQSQAEKFIRERTGHQLQLAPPEFNPLALRLHLGALTLTTPDNAPLLGFDEVVVDLSASSLFRRAVVFDDIRISGLKLTLVELPDGKINWSPLLDALKSKDDDTSSGLPRLDIQQFTLERGSIDFDDERQGTSGFRTRIEPLDIALKDVATITDERGQMHLAATLSQGAQLGLDATLTLNPLNVTGELSLANFGLATLSPYLKNILPGGAAEGTLTANTHYQLSHGGQSMTAAIDKFNLTLKALRVPLDKSGKAQFAAEEITVQDGQFQLATQQASFASVALNKAQLSLPATKYAPTLGSFSVTGGDIDLSKHVANIDSVTLNDGTVRAVRDAKGQLDLLAAVQALVVSIPPASTATKTSDATNSKAEPWQFQLKKLALDNWSLALTDASVSPAAELGITALSIQAQNMSDKLDKAIPLSLSASFPKGGKVSLRGTAIAAPASADLTLNLADLALTPLQPYLNARSSLRLVGGNINAQGQVRYSSRQPANTGYTGSIELRNLRIDEESGKSTLLAWRRLGTTKLSATTERLDIGELRLSGLDTTLIIDADKSSNLSRSLKPAPAAPEMAEVTSSDKPASPYLTTISRLRIDDGEVEFADKSLVLPFGTRIHALQGNITGLSSRPGRPGSLELDGEVDDFGQARAAGQIDLFNPTGFMDLRVIFRNVDMPRLTPYTATFAGRKIDSGKLSLDLQYKIKDRQLQGDNKVVIDRLVLGDRIESATAKDLPLNLAIAILEDSNGRIDLGLPITGNLDDPQFSYGQIVWQAITNVLSKIVTAPFRALGALFGSDEKIEGIAFEPGAQQLTPPEREKLVRVSSALAKRQNLNLAVRGVYTLDDRLALQDRQLRRTLITMAGEPLPADDDPGPVSTNQPKIQSALESLYGKRTSSADLAALKAGFRLANPGQLEESTTGKMMSRLSGLLSEKKSLSESEVTRLKGADFYPMLYERMRNTEAVADEKLFALAKARGDYAYAELLRYGAVPARTQLLPPEKGDSVELGVPLKLELAAGKPGTSP